MITNKAESLPKINKYHAERIEKDGFRFDSKAEAKRYDELLLLQRAGEIHDLKIHPEFLILKGYKYKYDDSHSRTRRYVGDFRYTRKDGQVIVEDVKGSETKDFRLKWAIVRDKYPDIWFMLIKAYPRGRRSRK